LIVDHDNLSHFVRDSGEGTPVILIHGFPDTGDLWRNQVSALNAAGYRTIVPDMRGRGQTSQAAVVGDYGLISIVGDVIAILDALDIPKAHVVGHDWGSAVAWLVAALNPSRATSLTAISVGFPAASTASASLESHQKAWYRYMVQFPEAEEIFQRNDWRMLRLLLDGTADTDTYIQTLSQPGALTAGLNWYRANLNPASMLADRPPLPRVSAPTLGIWSDGDNYLTEAAMQSSGDFVDAEFRYERLEGVDHWIPTGAPDKLNELLLSHLSSTG